MPNIFATKWWRFGFIVKKGENVCCFNWVFVFDYCIFSCPLWFQGGRDSFAVGRGMITISPSATDYFLTRIYHIGNFKKHRQQKTTAQKRKKGRSFSQGTLPPKEKTTNSAPCKTRRKRNLLQQKREAVFQNRFPFSIIYSSIEVIHKSFSYIA